MLNSKQISALRHLTKKVIRWKWTEGCQFAVEVEFARFSVLVYPDWKQMLALKG